MLMVMPAAQQYLASILVGQEAGTEIRVYVSEAGTSFARCGVCFCSSESFKSSDVIVDFEYVSVRIEQDIVPFLKDSIIDIVTRGLDSQLTFKAPYSKGLPGVGFNVKKNNKDYDDISLDDKIRDVLQSYINPQLSVHGGSVSLIRITDDFLVILRFSGGCNGCTMANYTMKLGIEATLKKFFPQLKGVRDVTEHLHGLHSYY